MFRKTLITAYKYFVSSVFKKNLSAKCTTSIDKVTWASEAKEEGGGASEENKAVGVGATK